MIANIPPKGVSFSDFICTFDMSFGILFACNCSTKISEISDMTKSWTTFVVQVLIKILNYSVAEFRSIRKPQKTKENEEKIYIYHSPLVLVPIYAFCTDR